MKHDHTHSVEVKLSPELQETVEQTKAVFENPTKTLIVGIIIGAVGMRLFSRPTVQQLIVVSGDAAIVE